MESVVFDGKEYIKASVLAERFNYTPDYLGQLCRAKKVDARLVGRAWYLNLDSLTGHRQTRYKANEKPQKASKESLLATPPHFLNRIDVESVLQKKTVKILKNNAKGRLSEFSVKYESDDYSLIPKISSDAVSRPIKILPADSKDVAVKAIRDSVRSTIFKAEPLPEVYLKGVLKVDGIPEAIHEEPEQPEVALAADKAALTPSTLTPVKAERADKQDLVKVRKAMKIKLYRTSKPHIISAAKEISGLSKSIEPVKNLHPINPVPNKAVPNNQIVVKKVMESPKNSPPAPVIKIEAIPHANLKAFIIFTLSLAVAIASLLPRQEIILKGGVTLERWKISLQSLSEILAFLVSLTA
ncbi:MAG: hypothetical protein AAB618_02215 [Patescibacteria group bacterium]